jgi:glycosyltransferase involved in cell wall biosynthesis
MTTARASGTMMRIATPTAPAMTPRPLLSIVVPMRNEARNIAALLARLGPMLDAQGAPCEIVAVDDGSSDDTLAVLKAARAREPRLKLVAFSRNFGKEVALAAGLAYARGQAVILIDADLQHPPELIDELVLAWRAGADMAYAVRRDRANESPLRRALAGAFYAIFDSLSATRLPRGAGDFRLLDRRVVDAINALPERTRFTKGLYAWLGFNQVAVPYDVALRHAGASAWSLKALGRFALDGIVSFSTVPLQLATWAGAVISALALLYAAVFVVRTLLYGIDVPGYPSLIVAIMFFSGIQLLFLGVIGEYVGRIFTEVKRRPLYVVAEEEGFEEGMTASAEVVRPAARRAA